MSNVKSLSAPFCPECREQMTRQPDNSWRCGCSPEREQDPPQELEPPQRRNYVLRILVTPATYIRCLRAAGGRPMSSWGNDVVISHLDDLERNSQEKM